jgi:hypothetical protein
MSSINQDRGKLINEETGDHKSRYKSLEVFQIIKSQCIGIYK